VRKKLAFGLWCLVGCSAPLTVAELRDAGALTNVPEAPGPFLLGPPALLVPRDEDAFAGPHVVDAESDADGGDLDSGDAGDAALSD